MQMLRLKKSELRDRLEVALLMVLENHQEIMASEDLDKLTKVQIVQILKWSAVVQFEASDNDCRARMAPKCLRDILPKDHYLQTWRKPKAVA